MAVNKTLESLLAIEAIKQLKYAYLRHLDLKEWDAVSTLFAPDVVSTYSDGKHSYQGRDAVMAFLSQSLSHKRIVTKHQVHHPEITLNEDLTAAQGVWYLTDAVINTVSRDPAKHFCIAGAAFYDERYIKTAEGWKIAAIGYRRVYEETTARNANYVLEYKNRFLGDFD
ncbi:MAG TPA: nuclear transport factor 2 family protein [Pseudomonadales bacterium]|nr:nuclear transport factor 2 family protein [Pseudomonadales bacterium]HNL91727.1 nuclear transport factor 2 family protein [Pseudomonadales bacterium]HNN86074.1 nuclear transport factor 2 family protein [Pseudomonadales bacterium]